MFIDVSKWNKRIQVALISLLLSASSIRRYNAYTLDSALVNSAINIGLVICSLVFLYINLSRLIIPILFEFIIAGIVIFNYFVYCENRIYMRNALEDEYVYLLIMILCIYAADKELIEKAMIISACCVFAFDTLLFCTPVYKNLLIRYDYGGVHAVYSYSLLFPLVMFMYMVEFKERKVMIIPAIISAYIMCLYGGNRMAMISFSSYLLYILWRGFRRKKRMYKILIPITMIIVIAVIIINMKTLLSHIIDYGESRKLTFRILELIFEKDFLVSRGRNEIFSILIQKALSWNGMIGYGICGDRLLTITHEYAHNIFLELIIEFGWINGGLISVGFILLLVYQVARNHEYRELVIVLIALKIISLMVSGTFWNATFFWIYIAICMKSFKVTISKTMEN